MEASGPEAEGLDLEMEASGLGMETPGPEMEAWGAVLLARVGAGGVKSLPEGSLSQSVSASRS